MAKTRSQTGNITIKKEEEDRKPTLCLNGVTKAARNKVTKRKPSRKHNTLLPAQQVKVEEDADTKSLLKSLAKLPKGRSVSHEQINQLIDYVANHGMSVSEASRRVKLSKSCGLHYYNVYKSDPEKKIPLSRSPFMHHGRIPTQEDIENFIKYINEDKMNVKEASAKSHITYNCGYYHYKRYLRNPSRYIHIPYSRQIYTQDQKNELIGYIVNDKMTIKAASKKAKMSADAGRRYYHEYFEDQHPDIATPNHIVIPKFYTQKQINELISGIVDDKMTIAAASRKVNINSATARTYYRQYLKDNNMELPVPRKCKQHTKDKINEYIGYIVDEKMSFRGASIKAKVEYNTGRKYYRQYLKDHNFPIPVPVPRRITQDQINQLIGYIVDDKMSTPKASKKAKMSFPAGQKYYQKYLKDHNLPIPVQKRITQDQINQLIGYIVDDKMYIPSASKKANMSVGRAYTYYHRYLNDQKK